MYERKRIVQKKRMKQRKEHTDLRSETREIQEKQQKQEVEKGRRKIDMDADRYRCNDVSALEK